MIFFSFPSASHRRKYKKQQRAEDFRYAAQTVEKAQQCWAFSIIYGIIIMGEEKMLERGKMERGIYEIVDTESLVSAEHLLRKIDAAVDWNKLYDMVEPL